MARRPRLSSEEILALARPVFVECGYGARTWQIASAVGLTWGAIALRFGSKRALFTQAMAGPGRRNGEAACERHGEADLPGLMERLRAHLGLHWPLRLQSRLAASAASPHEPEALADRLAAALEAHARQGWVRTDLSSKALASIVLALLTGDVAQRFVACQPVSEADPALIEGVIRLLSAP